MILAGVLLKLGSYGLLLFLPLVKQNMVLSLYMRLSLLGSVLGAIICIRQGDIKVLIAYSSIVHMGVVTLAFIRASELGYAGALMIIIGHGLRSPIIFALSYWMYERSHSRLISNNISTNPHVIICLGLLVSLNIGVPPSLRF